jgi:hypothetical protein
MTAGLFISTDCPTGSSIRAGALPVSQPTEGRVPHRSDHADQDRHNAHGDDRSRAHPSEHRRPASAAHPPTTIRDDTYADLFDDDLDIVSEAPGTAAASSNVAAILSAATPRDDDA